MRFSGPLKRFSRHSRRSIQNKITKLSHHVEFVSRAIGVASRPSNDAFASRSGVAPRQSKIPPVDPIVSNFSSIDESFRRSVPNFNRRIERFRLCRDLLRSSLPRQIEWRSEDRRTRSLQSSSRIGEQVNSTRFVPFRSNFGFLSVETRRRSPTFFCGFCVITTSNLILLKFCNVYLRTGHWPRSLRFFCELFEPIPTVRDRRRSNVRSAAYRTRN